MLSTDHVRAYAKGDELRLSGLSGAVGERALTLAQAFVDAFTEAEGERIVDLMSRFEAIVVGHREKKIAAAFTKLLLDRCSTETELLNRSPFEVRKELFLMSAKVRAESESKEAVDCDALLAKLGEDLQVDGKRVEQMLFCDLKSGARIAKTDPIDAQGLLTSFVEGQIEAILLKATRANYVFNASKENTRYIFRKLKFHRLLAHVRGDKNGYQITVEGPHRLFKPTTKYGLQIALFHRALGAADSWQLNADIQWKGWSGRGTRSQKTLKFYAEGGGKSVAENIDLTLSDDLQNLLNKWRAKENAWTLEEAADIQAVEGGQVLVPDLVACNGRRRVLIEAVGYWNRESAFRRADTAAKLEKPYILLIPERLRVGEAAFATPEYEHVSALVYKTAISVRALEKLLNTLFQKL